MSDCGLRGYACYGKSSRCLQIKNSCLRFLLIVFAEGKIGIGLSNNTIWGTLCKSSGWHVHRAPLKYRKTNRHYLHRSVEESALDDILHNMTLRQGGFTSYQWNMLCFLQRMLPSQAYKTHNWYAPQVCPKARLHKRSRIIRIVLGATADAVVGKYIEQKSEPWNQCWQHCRKGRQRKLLLPCLR